MSLHFRCLLIHTTSHSFGFRDRDVYILLNGKEASVVEKSRNERLCVRSDGGNVAALENKNRCDMNMHLERLMDIDSQLMTSMNIHVNETIRSRVAAEEKKIHLM